MVALEFATDGQASRGVTLAQWTRAVCALILLSSFSALIGQLAWQQILVRRFGADAELVTILIVAVGLGHGCLVGGLLSRRRIALGPILALLAGASGVCAFLSPLNATGWGIVVAPLISALLMGAMVPVAVGHLVRRNETVGAAIGEVLFVALLGAGAACLAGVTILLPVLGERGSLDVAAAIHAMVALSALVAHWLARQAVAKADDATSAFWRQPQLAFLPVLALAGAAGFLALSYALFFVRILSHAAYSQGVVLTATLGGFLIGLAAGARRAGTHCALFSAEELMRRAARSATATNLVGLAALPLLAQLAWLDRAVIIVAMLLCLLAARACGALLPYFAELGIAADARAGQRGALALLAYLIGAAAGALAASLVLVQRLSLVTIGVALVVSGVLFTLMLIAILDLPRWQKIVRSLSALAVVLLALTLMPYWSANVVERLGGKGPAANKPVVQSASKHALARPSSGIARGATG